MNEKLSQKFADATTIHAVKDFYYASPIGKAFWGLLAVIAAVGLSLQLEGVILQFAKQDTGATMTAYTPPNLPEVGICPDRWVSREKAEAYNFTAKSVSIINGFMPMMGITQMYSMSAEQSLKMFEVLAKTAKIYSGAEYEKVLDLYHSTGSNIDALVDAVGLAELDTEYADIFPLMGTLDKRERHITPYGVCYSYEVSMVMNAKQAQYAGTRIQFGVWNALPPDVGVLEPHFWIRLGIGSFEKRVQYGRHYLIQYSLTRISRLSTRRWPCKHLTLKDEYHCATSHSNDIAKKQGRCETALAKTSMYKATVTSDPCNTFVDLPGSNTFKYININYTDRAWNAICPRPCDYTEYQFTVHEKQLLFDPQEVNQSHSYTLLEVQAAGGMSGVQIREYLIVGIPSLMSNVGGTLGLFIGASVMSVIQVFYVFCLGARWTCCHPLHSDIAKRAK